jgi:uncharacterized protein YigE (DUF2233 family)
MHHTLLVWTLLLSSTLGILSAQSSPDSTATDRSIVVQPDSLALTSKDALMVDSLQAITTADSLIGLDSATLALLTPLQAKIDSLEAAADRWKQIADRRLTREFLVDSFRTYAFRTCIVNPQKVPIQLFNRYGKRKAHTFATLGELAKEQGKKVVFAMNAGMYERNRLAKGLMIVDGELQQKIDTLTRGYGNFYLQPNGIFALDSAGKAFVTTTQHFPHIDSTHAISYATQSGPMMVIEGKINPLFNDGSPNRHIRNAVGVTPDNQVVFAISERPVTFFELSSFMIAQGCTNALYLDGAISQGYFPELDLGSLDQGDHLGPIILIVE